ncbi:unnamed protein product [Trichobilharzia szidati]|nr:unnamed protein product [Trichobilharzia szidati]
MSVSRYQNDVYESSSSPVLSSTDDQCSLIDEGYWHDNDLVLAAELGKALLDRNRKLELALEKSKFVEREKSAEIEFLIKELTSLRELSNRKMEFVDEADRYNQELSNSNRQLMRKISEDQQKIQRLSNTIASLEDQVAGLTERLKKCECQAMITEKRSAYSHSSPMSTYRRRSSRHSISSSSSISSAIVSSRKMTTVVSAATAPTTTTNNNNNNINKSSINNDNNTFFTRHWNRSLRSKNYFPNRSKSNQMSYSMNRRYSSQRNPSRRKYHEKGGLFYIDDDFFDQPEIGTSAHHNHHHHRRLPQSSISLEIKTNNKQHSQLSNDASILSKRGGQHSSTLLDRDNNYDDVEDDDDTAYGIDYNDCISDMQRLSLYRTFSWPRINDEIFDDRFDEPPPLQSDYDNTFQYRLNNEHNTGKLFKENEDSGDDHDEDEDDLHDSDRDTPTTTNENKQCRESSNAKQLCTSSESVLLSNSTFNRSCEADQIHSSTPCQRKCKQSSSSVKDTSEGETPNCSSSSSADDDKEKPRIADQINDLLDDINFVSCLDRIYNPHIRSQYQDLINKNYKPAYKQLFHETFTLLKTIRNNSNNNNSNKSSIN